MSNKRLQYIWHKDWQGIHFRKAAHGLSLTYDWYLWCGFLEIRKWHVLKPGDIERYDKEGVKE